jgi:excisionase family DNA binding protein
MGRTPEILSAQAACKFLGISHPTLRDWLRKGVGPPRTLKGKRYWYSREALKEWLKSGASAAVEQFVPSQPGRTQRLSTSGASAFPHSDPPRRYR